MHRAQTQTYSARCGLAPSSLGALTAVAALLVLSAASTEGACPTGIPGYSLSINLAVDGGDLSGPFTDVQSAISDCSLKADCTGVAGSGTAFMTKKGSMIPTSASVGACLYVKLPTVCPPLASYTSIADVDSQGAATSGFSAGGPITNARAACDPTQDCLGFDSKSFTARSSLFPMVYSRGTCFYVKLPTRCPDVTGYTALPDTVPISGSSNLIDVKKPGELPGCCNRESSCIGFTSAGARYSGVAGTTYKRGACWYTKSGTGATCPAVTGYTAVPDKDLATAIIKKLSSSAAAAADCSTDATCGGFTSDGWRTRKNGTKLVDSFTNCFYRKDVIDRCASADVSVNCTNTPGSFIEVCAPGYENYNATARTCSASSSPPCPSVQGFTLLHNKDVPASSILTKILNDSYTDADQCNALGACISFSTSGPSNATSSDFIDSPGTCVYTRTYMDRGCEELWATQWLVNTTLVPDTGYILGLGPYSTPQDAEEACGDHNDICYGWINDGRLFANNYNTLIDAPGRCFFLQNS